MSANAQISDHETEANALKLAFLRWQCRVRMIAMREHQGRPDTSVAPVLTPKGATESLGPVITVLSKSPRWSKLPELRQMALKTFDPALRRENALEFFSATYFQKGHEFSDVLTAVFPEDSPAAQTIRKVKYCDLDFDAYGQRFRLSCQIWKLAPKNPLYQATWWHNHLFNPKLSKAAIILGFEPDWAQSSGKPPVK